ncbi:MAG: sensor histidine kinase [Halofilum sp. (in: g-proteobacteria)]|nr:sensor histidine kinase [Halofilum sp. (in: g-proteobacteria)]
MSAAAEREAAFLPDFCEQGNLLRTMVIAELLAIVLAAAQPGAWLERLQALALLSLFIQWVAVVDIALLCLVQGPLARRDDRVAALLAFVLLQAVTVAFTLVAWGLTTGLGLPLTGRPLGLMLLEHGVISAIVSALVLRYFYVSAQWRRNVQAEAQARVQALQARIRPHFLFNSMNTIASLTRTSPEQAEVAVEDLSELFRASLTERSMLPLEEELALVASYLRIEHQRLGERLQVEWDLDPAAGEAEVPALTLQPLAENAVYHGIERRAGGGRIAISSHRLDDGVEIRIRNPLPAAGTSRQGHRMAQDNVRQRLLLAFGERASMEIATEDEDYVVRVRIPAAEGGTT